MDRAATLIALLVTALGSSACVGTTSNVCEDGSICPGGFVCDVDHERCLLPEQISACDGVVDDAPCTLPSEPTAGAACRAGACVAYFCGDGYVTAGEQCEPAQSAEELGANCKDFGAYTEAGLQCSASCAYDPGSKEQHTGCYMGPFCGDLETNGPELCDGPETRTCVTIGYDAGTTECTLDCGFTVGNCSRFGWSPESIGQVYALGVAGAAVNDQWAFGLAGKLEHFEGAFWNVVPSGVTDDFINGWSFGAKDTWIIGESVVLHWDGNAISTVSGTPSDSYVDVWGPSPNDVYLATRTGVARFNGSTWTTLPAVTGTPRVLRGSAANDLWLATQSGPLKHFDGATWTDRSPPGVAVEFLDVNAPDDAWAIGALSSDPGSGVIAHWNGTSWDLWTTAQTHYNAIASTGPADTWVAGVDGIMRHWDGVAWALSQNIGASPTGLTAISGLLAIAPDAIVGVSTLNLAYRYRGQAFGSFKPLGTDPFDAPDNVAIWGTAANDQFVSNVKGEVWHFDGIAWTLVFTTPTAEPSRDLDGRADNDLWMVASDGNAYRYDGTSWTTFAVTPGIPLNRVWVDKSTGDAWLFGSGGAFHRVGTEWVYSPIATGVAVSVSGSTADNLWVVLSDPASLWHYDGLNWTEVVTGSQFEPLAVAALSKEDIHVTLTQGHFAHSNGTAWTETALPVLADLRMIAASAPDDIVAASERDLVHFNGIAWSTIRTPIDFVPNTSDYLPMTDLQVTPGRIDMLLQRFRIRTLIRTRPLICRIHETCGDAVDNDCNGKIDAQDTECQ